MRHQKHVHCNYLKKLHYILSTFLEGMPWLMRKMATKMSPSQDVKQEGDKFQVKVTTGFMIKEWKFTIGEEFEEKPFPFKSETAKVCFLVHMLEYLLLPTIWECDIGFDERIDHKLYHYLPKYEGKFPSHRLPTLSSFETILNVEKGQDNIHFPLSVWHKYIHIQITVV